MSKETELNSEFSQPLEQPLRGSQRWDPKKAVCAAGIYTVLGFGYIVGAVGVNEMVLGNIPNVSLDSLGYIVRSSWIFPANPAVPILMGVLGFVHSLAMQQKTNGRTWLL